MKCWLMRRLIAEDNREVVPDDESEEGKEDESVRCRGQKEGSRVSEKSKSERGGG